MSGSITWLSYFEQIISFLGVAIEQEIPGKYVLRARRKMLRLARTKAQQEVRWPVALSSHTIYFIYRITAIEANSQ